MGISITQLVIILAIVVVLFGTKRLKNIGGDLGGAIKGFRSAMQEGEQGEKLTEKDVDIIESQVSEKQKDKV